MHTSHLCTSNCHQMDVIIILMTHVKILPATTLTNLYNHQPISRQGKKLRQIVDDRYTARVLLGLSQTYKNDLGENFDVQTSATICQNGNVPCSIKGSSNLTGCDDTNISNDGGSNEDENYLNNADGTTMGADQSTTTKRARRRGKYTPQEREKIRYFKPILGSIGTS